MHPCAIWSAVCDLANATISVAFTASNDACSRSSVAIRSIRSASPTGPPEPAAPGSVAPGSVGISDPNQARVDSSHASTGSEAAGAAVSIAGAADMPPR
jgi:hypothetical protein